MKRSTYVVVLVSIICLLFSCTKNDDFNYKSDFENSKEAFLKFKQNSNNSYTYIITGSSFAVDYGWETTITVVRGEVVKREFRYLGAAVNIPDSELAWVEQKEELNTHKFSSAAEPLTLDVIYEKAENDWLLKRKGTTTYFELENDGLISVCGYVESGCMDDCFVGITIKSIVALQQN